MIRIERGGEHTRLHSTLCERCPHGPTGCCASPPGVDWADIGRILTLGGQQWLMAQMERGDLRPGPRGLLIRRVTNSEANAGTWPTKCVYHGPQGCTISPDHRAATCNYYMCDDAFLFGGLNQGEPPAVTGQEMHAQLMALYGRWDLAIMARIATDWPGGPAWDAPFLSWLERAYKREVHASRRDLRSLQTTD